MESTTRFKRKKKLGEKSLRWFQKEKTERIRVKKFIVYEILEKKRPTPIDKGLCKQRGNMKMRAKFKNEKMYRIQFELDELGVKHLEKLRQVTNVATRKDLLNNAVTLLEWAIKEKQKGRVIASIDEKNERYKEIEMPVLSNAAKSEVSI